MYCKTFRCTLPVADCLKRQTKVRDKLENGNNLLDPGSKQFELLFCLECDTGTKVKENPRKHIDRDVRKLAKDHQKVIEQRGWVHKESIKIANNISDDNPTKGILKKIDSDLKRERTMKSYAKRNRKRPD